MHRDLWESCEHLTFRFHAGSLYQDVYLRSVCVLVFLCSCVCACACAIKNHVSALQIPVFSLTFDPLCAAAPGGCMGPPDSQLTNESERSREQILQTLSDLSRGFQDIADRCLLVLHLEVR